MEKVSRSEITIGILAIVSIIVVAVEALVELSTTSLVIVYAIDFLICAVFGWDFVNRLRKTDNKPRFFKKNGYELLAMIPAAALYLLGTIPAISVALRSLRLLRVVRIVLVVSRIRRLFSSSGNFIMRSNLLAMFVITVSLVFIGAFAVFLLEADSPSAQITNFSDAVWWSLSTVTTVGYGDVVPYSITGRIIGMGLMVVGIGVMASLISQVSATLVESRINRKCQKDDLKTKMVEEIKNHLDNIEDLSESEVLLMVKMIQTLKTGGYNKE